VPYVPILGNHDVWPYTGSTEAPYPFGDQYFKEVFASTFNNLQSVMPGWNNGTRLTRV
jgi:3',5'-cyclic AMP phosphodiesterase CpdA